MPEHAYLAAAPAGARLEHRYGPNVHILSDPWALSVLARLGHPDCKTPEANNLLETAYRRLLEAASEQLRSVVAEVDTRMIASCPQGRFVGRVIDRRQRVICVDIARAGMLPAHIFQRHLHDLVEPEGVRVDHLFMARVADPVTHAVIGVDFAGSKIGGDVDGATIFVPDPMAATGVSMAQALDHYATAVPGRPTRVVTCHLIVTPEYLKRITTRFPNVVVYALRLDRGLSPESVLATPPGTHWEQERGLDDRCYIVPGAGGLGELINNSWV
jgi:uracil phosphoribosyltransferase